MRSGSTVGASIGVGLQGVRKMFLNLLRSSTGRLSTFDTNGGTGHPGDDATASQAGCDSPPLVSDALLLVELVLQLDHLTIVVVAKPPGECEWGCDGECAMRMSFFIVRLK